MKELFRELFIENYSKNKIDFDLVDLDKDFNYVNEVKINNQCVVLDFSVKRHGWSSEFIKHFVQEYNRNVKDMK